MNQTTLKTILFLFVISMLTSCALSNSIQKINYKPTLNITNQIASSKQVKIESMKDDRGYNDGKVIFYKKNMYNQTMSGAYLEEKPVSEILMSAIENGLKEKGINYDSVNGDVFLKSWLQKLDYQSISGFSTVQLIPEITVKFQLLDSDHKVIWTDIITGKAKTKGTNFEKFMPPAIDDLVMKLIENQEFLNAINKN